MPDAGPLIALTTDFGWGSSYVAQMKGVLYSAVPSARIVDVSHTIPAQSIRHAEVLLRSSAFAFPVGTTHVVVIDPGVGTERRGIAVQARGTTFVGPDNGVLGAVLAQPGARAVCLDRPHLFRQPVSATFHGRDVFSPVAAELAAGLLLEDVGTPVDDPVPSTLPAPHIADDHVAGETLAADDFGNLFTNITSRELDPEWRVFVEGRELARYTTYGAAPGGTPFALVGSDGYLEIAVRDGSAESVLGGEPLSVWCGP